MSADSRSAAALGRESLADIAESALECARRLGSSAADVEVSSSEGLNVTARLGEVETIEFNRDKGLGITVYVGQSRGNASTTDFSAEAVQRTVEAALAIARHTAPDPFAGLPERALHPAAPFRDCDLYHPWALDTEAAIALCKRMEKAGMAV
ncbi:MAG TPA: DNA gyrase modulator, partial [Usitatibacteraceae bacterium]|nr:DNA gyrase modulator [Usitatibacteraceae bacterium]